jgi:uncharacterized protein YcbK (DUF882 family)
MRRTTIILLFLAVLFGTAAYGSPAHPARSRKSGVTTAAPRKKQHTSATPAGRQPRTSAGKRAASTPSFGSTHRHRSGSRWAVVRRVTVRPAVVQTESLNQGRSPTPLAMRGDQLPEPPPLRGSYESLVRQNEKTETDNLERIEDEDDLADRIARGMLVPVPVSSALTVNGKLPKNHRYCRRWTAEFLADLARAHAEKFHSPVMVSSAVRTVEYQKQLMKINGNAAEAEGDVASPHLTGATIDIAKQGLSRQEIGWMRAWLLPLETAGKIDVEEEFKQACFHITVYKSYLSPQPSPGASPQRQSSEPQAGVTVQGI